VTPELTVVIATRDRPQALARCLEALRRQIGVGALQLVVVDDGSRDRDAVAAVAAEMDAELVRLPGSGLAAARNDGVARARAPFVGFLDDDSEPTPAWGASMVRRLRGGAAAVTGPIAAEPRADRLGTASQLVANSLVDADAASKGTTRSAPSTNLACRLVHAREITFDEAYAGIGAEDRDWCARLANTGENLAFDPDAVVRHAQNLTLRDFCYRQYQYGRGARVYRGRHESGRLEPARFYAGLIRDGFRRGPVVGILVIAAQLATAAGYFRQALARDDLARDGLVSRRTESEAENRAA
jgi:glycosyltransferase involved in cell wall biosynthesis